MSRYEETEETCNESVDRLKGLLADELTIEEVIGAQQSAIINILTEIALSLAVIADEVKGEQ